VFYECDRFGYFDLVAFVGICLVLVLSMNTVLAHGCFDLLHLGHIRHLTEARSLGDRLVVSITCDAHVNKGPGRPHFTAEQRREALLSLECVDEVIISETGTAVDSIYKIKPAVYVKGPDYANTDNPYLAIEREAVELIGGSFHITTAEKWSSTELLRTVKLSDAALAYIEGVRKYLPDILQAFERADKLKIAFIGETVIDEYRYVKPLAKPSKEFILAVVGTNTEKFNGGVRAAAKHGEWRGAEVITSFATITKTRFVDADFSRKLFEVYSSREIEIEADERVSFRKKLGELIVQADLCIAFDFGHGLLGQLEREALQTAKFLAVTAQANAGNYGFNSVFNYHRADYVCVDEPEAMLTVRDRHIALPQIVRRIANRLQTENIVITRGRYGCLVGDVAIPAFVSTGFDTMGAGDAFLAVSAPLVAAGLPLELAAFVGNVAGGLKTAILGHRQHVGRDDILKNIEWLLK
jgi:rfaE bifunctional protein nucleotidyltransferase chain/domain